MSFKGLLDLKREHFAGFPDACEIFAVLDLATALDSMRETAQNHLPERASRQAVCAILTPDHMGKPGGWSWTRCSTTSRSGDAGTAVWPESIQLLHPPFTDPSGPWSPHCEQSLRPRGMSSFKSTSGPACHAASCAAACTVSLARGALQ